MIKYNNIESRNLQEQVLKNKEDIASLYATDRVLAQLGIKVLGQKDTAADLPQTGNEYGDGYAVGLEPPYDFYIWTRGNEDTQEPDFWFNIGKLAIVGPQGPAGQDGRDGAKGEKGDKGDRGQDGQTGAQGPMGLQGPPGRDGEPGPKGDTGDVGGFINLAGIVPSESALPTPTSLKDLTKAYLVGTASPYYLYVQVGETSETAIWHNMGILNVATYVTVNGQFQNVWDADTKVDKYTGTAYKVYVHTPDGDSVVNYAQSAIQGDIPQRTTNGNIEGPEASKITQDDYYVTKEYVDDQTVVIIANETQVGGIDGVFCPDLTSAQIRQIYLPYTKNKKVRVQTTSDTRRYYDVLICSDFSCTLIAQRGYIIDYYSFGGEVAIETHNAILNKDLNDSSVVTGNNYYRHIGTTSENFTHGVIYFYSGGTFKAIDGSGGGAEPTATLLVDTTTTEEAKFKITFTKPLKKMWINIDRGESGSIGFQYNFNRGTGFNFGGPIIQRYFSGYCEVVNGMAKGYFEGGLTVYANVVYIQPRACDSIIGFEDPIYNWPAGTKIQIWGIEA